MEKKLYLLSAASEGERQEWVKALNQASFFLDQRINY